jgi:starch synthase
MEIIFVTTELSPFVKVGGLADVSAALPKALRALGHAVTIVMPRFPALEEHGLLLARRLTPLRFTLGDQAIEATLLDGRLASQVDLVVVDVPGLFDRPGVYGERGDDYVDNVQRFAVLSRAAAELARQRVSGGRAVDIVHCNDWPTALVPGYLGMLASETPALAASRTVLTIHNVAYKGEAHREQLVALGFASDSLAGRGSLLEHGIVSADAVTTVSPTYAREIRTPELGAGLDKVLRDRGEALVGIANGVDYAVWNPATDSAIAARYDAEDFANKARCKGALQKELGLPLDAHSPLVANVGRMVEQKGTDLVAAMIPKLLRGTDAQVVVTGDGASDFVSILEKVVAKSHGRSVFVHAANEGLVHRIFAAADLVLIPSRYEPCGLVQMYAQRYGALPVARATGGLVDTVVDCDAALETGTGFLFEPATAEALLGATERAIAARTRPRWPALVRRVMKLDNGWEGPARRYDQLYRVLGSK